jgi:hypothetical protein
VKWRTTTSGEQLFLFIREDVLPELPASGSAWSHVGQVLSDVGGSRHFAGFFRGATAIQSVRRLLAFCKESLEMAGSGMHVRLIADFASEEVFPGLDRDNLGRLGRLASAAYRASDTSATKATKSRLLRGLVAIRCYLCGLVLDEAACDGELGFVSLDHIWPASLGGESTDANLLPACLKCQVKKADGLSWEWLNLYNLSWPSMPSPAHRDRVELQVKIARHFHHATEFASAEQRTLKWALAELGPIASPTRFEPTGWPATFFDLHTIG